MASYYNKGREIPSNVRWKNLIDAISYCDIHTKENIKNPSGFKVELESP